MKKKIIIILSSVFILSSCGKAFDEKGNTVKESSSEIMRQCENELSKANDFKTRFKFLKSALDEPELMTTRSRYFQTENVVKCEGNKQRVYNIMTVLKKDNQEKSKPEYDEKEKQAEKEIQEYLKGYRGNLLDFEYFGRILLKWNERDAYEDVSETLKSFYEFASSSTPFLYYESKNELIRRYKGFTGKDFANYSEMFKTLKEMALSKTSENKNLLCQKLAADFPDVIDENRKMLVYHINFPNSLNLAYFNRTYYDSKSEMLLTICPSVTSLAGRIEQEKREDDRYYRRRRYYDTYNNYNNNYNNNSRSGFYSDNDDDDYSSSSSSSSSSSRSYKAPSSRHSSGSSSSGSSSSSSRSYKAPSSRRSSGGSSSGSSGSHHRPSGRRSRH